MNEVIFISDFFVDDYQGGAELTTEALIEDSPFKIKKIQSSSVDIPFVEKNKEKFWIFGNFAGLDEKAKFFFIKYVNYSVIEYDYKYCRFRSDDIHKIHEGECSCERERKDCVGSHPLLIFLRNI